MMKSTRTTSVEEIQLVSRFEGLRRTLLAGQYAASLEKPLAFWALPSDRRLPLALLGRTLNELLHTPFSELASTPGIGLKKLRCFVKLLDRVVTADPVEPRDDLEASPENGKSGPGRARAADGFDPSSVSELVWTQWRGSVVRHGLADEPLGRLAPSLKNITRAVWHTPLGDYTDKTLDEIRAMKTHGQKRVRTILEAFHAAHSVLSQVGTSGHLAVRVVPRLIDSVERWIDQVVRRPGIPGEDEIFLRFVNPLLKQIRCDGSRQVIHLAETRLGVHGPVTSVRDAARSLGLTRARIYQLLSEINDLVTVRWPYGRHQVREVAAKFEAELPNLDRAPNLEQFRAAVELFCPASRRAAARPVQPSGKGHSGEGPADDDKEPMPALSEESGQQCDVGGLLTG
jgi:hypothetical protein